MSTPQRLVIRNAQVEGQAVDVLIGEIQIGDARIVAIGPELDLPPSVESIDGRGGALIPGLHDHHVHLLAVAAAAHSVDVSELDRDGFVAAVRRADSARSRGSWIRVIGYHESGHGALDRAGLDAVVRMRPVRVQHATGAMWVLNSAAIDAVGLDDAPLDRVERDALGTPTGRIFGLDDWLHRALPALPLDLAAVGRRLAGFGICGVTDATPYATTADIDLLRTAVASNAIRQHVVATGAPGLDRSDLAPLIPGPAKLIVDDRDPPDIDALADQIAGAHRRGLGVAMHCASRLAIVLAVAALEQAGTRPGDRIEHGAVVPPELVGRLRALGVTVVTQPAFVHARGDRYLAEVGVEDLPYLWPCQTLITGGIPVGFGSDAPHGPLDPWVAIRAAVDRRTRTGHSLGSAERIDVEHALARFLTTWSDPGGPVRRVAVGAPADLCLLHVPLTEVLRDPRADAVRLTIIDGAVVDG